MVYNKVDESDPNQPRGWADVDVLDSAGDRVGTVDDLYYDDTTGRPEWLLVSTGLFGLKKTFVPATAVRREGDYLIAALSKDRIKDAPRIDDDEVLSEDDERELYRYYGLDYDVAGRDYVAEHAATYRGEPTGAAEGRDTALTRSEEELRLQRVLRPRETVRLKKAVEGEPVTRPTDEETVREELRSERIDVERERLDG